MNETLSIITLPQLYLENLISISVIQIILDSNGTKYKTQFKKIGDADYKIFSNKNQSETSLDRLLKLDIAKGYEDIIKKLYKYTDQNHDEYDKTVLTSFMLLRDARLGKMEILNSIKLLIKGSINQIKDEFVTTELLKSVTIIHDGRIAIKREDSRGLGKRIFNTYKDVEVTIFFNGYNMGVTRQYGKPGVDLQMLANIIPGNKQLGWFFSSAVSAYGTKSNGKRSPGVISENEFIRYVKELIK